MEFEKKLDLLGAEAAAEVSCQTCAANPNAQVVTHRANQPIRAADILLPSQGGTEGATRPRHRKPWLASAIRSDGKKIALVKTIAVQSKGFSGNGRI